MSAIFRATVVTLPRKNGHGDKQHFQAQQPAVDYITTHISHQDCSPILTDRICAGGGWRRDGTEFRCADSQIPPGRLTFPGGASRVSSSVAFWGSSSWSAFNSTTKQRLQPSPTCDGSRHCRSYASIGRRGSLRWQRQWRHRPSAGLRPDRLPRR
jgi:hypothetical protein